MNSPRSLLLSAVLGSTVLCSAANVPGTWCNPISLPDYPVGRGVRTMANGSDLGAGGLWLSEKSVQYRELADPTAIWEGGKWYLYPSCDMAWVSEDEGLTWTHHPLNVRDIGYAPTVVKHQGRFLLMASDSAVYTSASPLGPFEKIGPIQLPKTEGMPGQTDPMLFSDNGRLFYYWGCSPRSGIWGAELDASDPTRVISTPAKLVPYRPDLFPWEACGNWNQNTPTGWMEGGWMIKVGKRYYLTFSTGGTQYRTYAMGCYVSDSPMGPFVPQTRNPIFRSTSGLINGTGHGCLVEGPRGHVYTFYTAYAGVVHGFERRLGFDVAAIDEKGELYVPTATSTPQRLPEAGSSAPGSVSTGWLPLNEGERTVGSSSAPNLDGRFAVDNNLTTWWQPTAGDQQPVLTTAFAAPAMVNAVRVVWRDVGLDTVRGVQPGPFRYRVEVETAPGTWQTVVDASANSTDLLNDYRECAPTVATRARLVILGAPKGITPGVVEFTLFGVTVPFREGK